MRPEAVFADSAVVAVPGVTTTYDLTASGPGGVDSTSTAVAVLRETVLDTIVPVSFELGLSGVGVVAGAARLGVPTLSAAAAWSNWHLELRGGLRPRGASGPDPLSPVDPRPQFGDRTQKLVSLSVAYFPTAWRGASPGAVSAGVGLSYVAGWETVRELDQFMIRAHGPAVGPRFRLRRGLWSFGGGLDLQYAHVTEFDEPVSRWEFGVIPSITFTYVFD